MESACGCGGGVDVRRDLSSGRYYIYILYSSFSDKFYKRILLINIEV
jgi:hypothetical protein